MLHYMSYIRGQSHVSMMVADGLALLVPVAPFTSMF